MAGRVATVLAVAVAGAMAALPPAAQISAAGGRANAYFQAHTSTLEVNNDNDDDDDDDDG